MERYRRLNYLLDILSIAAIDFCPSLVAWQNFLKCASTGHSVVKVLGSEPGLRVQCLTILTNDFADIDWMLAKFYREVERHWSSANRPVTSLK